MRISRAIPAYIAVQLILMHAMGLGGAAESTATAAVILDTVRVGISQEPDTLNRLFAQTAASRVVAATLFTVDVQRDHGGRLFPQGVTELPSPRTGTWKVSGEKMTLHWQLRPRTWQDGVPVTCDDYVYSHHVARDVRVPVAVRDLTNRISGVACPDGARGTKVAVTWKELYPYAHTVITEFGALPRHLLEKFYRQDPANLDEAPYGHDPKVTVGDGAYRLVEWRKGSSITVESVGKHSIFATPKIKRVIWRFIPDTNALVAQMLSGAIDVISTIGISFDQAAQLEQQARGRIKVFFEPGLIWEHIDFNLDNPILQDVRVRRAIAHAINREQISQRLFQGRQPVSHTYLPPRHPGFTDQVARYLYDPARARALLREAGWTAGADGALRNAAGHRLSLEFNTTAGHRVREQVEQIIQRDLRAVGIELTIQNFPARVLFDEITSRRRFKALAMYAWVLAPTSDCDQLYTEDGIPSEANGWSGQNYPGYRNPEMDRACKAASRAVDVTKWAQVLSRSARIFSRDLPALPLYVHAAVAAAKVELRNFEPVALGDTYETWNAPFWSWK